MILTMGMIMYLTYYYLTPHCEYEIVEIDNRYSANHIVRCALCCFYFVQVSGLFDRVTTCQHQNRGGGKYA